MTTVRRHPPEEDWDEPTETGGHLLAELEQGPSTPYVVFLSGAHLGELLRLEPGRAVVIGRGREADLKLQDPSLSRAHARLRLDEELLVVEDLASKNGTWVAGLRVDTVHMAPGDRGQLGLGTIFRFVLKDAAEREMIEELRARALIDPHTDLPTAAYFRIRIGTETQHAARHGQALSLVAVRLDRFERLAAAPQRRALALLGERVRRAVRVDDVAARTGDAEVSLLLRTTPLGGARVVAERVRDAFALEPISLDASAPALTVSLGAAELARGEDGSPERLAADAARALDEAVRRGGNQVVLADER